jgi:alanine racemase
MLESHSWAEIDLQALRHNFQVARQSAPNTRICAVIKANAYGHGADKAAEALATELKAGDCFAVATLFEARRLRRSHQQHPILILRGPVNAQELQEIVLGGYHWVLHSPWQADLLKELLDQRKTDQARHDVVLPVLNIWLKVNTGMNRLGLPPDQLKSIWHWLQQLPEPSELVLMSHFATADEPGHVLAHVQLKKFQALSAEPQLSGNSSLSMAASAGILAWPQSHFSIVRPGIMLYGASPMLGGDGSKYGLRPVMNLKSRLVAVNEVREGDSVGYGATYHATEDIRVGVIGIGYGDGYPRHAPSGTPVLIFAKGEVWEVPLSGRVSMDMLTVDLRGVPAEVGDEVLLWGQSWGQVLPAERIAVLCNTIAYELFCQITSRVQYIYR